MVLHFRDYRYLLSVHSKLLLLQSVHHQAAGKSVTQMSTDSIFHRRWKKSCSEINLFHSHILFNIWTWDQELNFPATFSESDISSQTGTTKEWIKEKHCSPLLFLVGGWVGEEHWQMHKISYSQSRATDLNSPHQFHTVLIFSHNLPAYIRLWLLCCDCFHSQPSVVPSSTFPSPAINIMTNA